MGAGWAGLDRAAGAGLNGVGLDGAGLFGAGRTWSLVGKQTGKRSRRKKRGMLSRMRPYSGRYSAAIRASLSCRVKGHSNHIITPHWEQGACVCVNLSLSVLGLIWTRDDSGLIAKDETRGKISSNRNNVRPRNHIVKIKS